MPGTMPGTPHISSFNIQKYCYYFLFTVHELEAHEVKGLSKLTQQ